MIGRLVTAASAAGQAQAAFEIVLKYTGDRIVANKPIRQHSIAAGILAEMAIGIETARWSYLAAAWMYDHPDKFGAPTLPLHSLTGKHCENATLPTWQSSVTNKAMELMGSFGYVREYDVEKYWRDCKIIQLWEGGAQLGRLDVCRGYYDCNF